MHFNSSCSYAGLANLLELLDYNTEDYKIALAMDLPCFIKYDSKTKTYVAGAILQSKEWFNLYLKPRGFCYNEVSLLRKEAINNLHFGTMLGIRISDNQKHAVIFIKKKEEDYYFLNNKRENSQEKDVIKISKCNLLNSLPNEVVMGYITKYQAEKINIVPYYNDAILTWEKLQSDIQKFIKVEQSPKSLRESMNRLFRPLLVDELAMLELLDKKELVNDLKTLQGTFLKALKKNKSVVLNDVIDSHMIDKIINFIITIIHYKIKNTKK